MQVYFEDLEDDAGYHYALLRDSVSLEIVQRVEALLVNGEYLFSFRGVGPGSYIISAGTDTDNDGLVCESGEACGVYPIPSYILPIVVDSASGNRNGINFETSFENVINVNRNEFPLVKLNQSLY